MGPSTSEELIKADLVVTGASRLVTLAVGRIAGATGKLGAIKRGALAAQGGRIVWVGPEDALRDHVDIAAVAPANRYDARRSAVLPGFVDSHTHFVFAGDRAREFWLRRSGVSQDDIVRRGGGILKTVQETQAASYGNLRALAIDRLHNFAQHGTTTVEGKTGYGLELSAEAKCLRIMNELDEQPDLPRVISTFLGAHTIPTEFQGAPASREAYLDLVCSEMLPRFVGQARFCDVFCDRTAFTVEEARRILELARDLGYALKIHADQTENTGGTRLAAELGVVSADHLDFATDQDLELLRKRGVVATLLPGCSFGAIPTDSAVSGPRRSTAYPSARRFLAHGLDLALATDFNPGTSYCENMQMIIALAVNAMGMSLEDAIYGATLGGAHALGVEREIGSLEVGKACDLIVLRCAHEQELAYHFGVNLVSQTILRGKPTAQSR
jgi:imidazolonepropionase